MDNGFAKSRLITGIYAVIILLLILNLIMVAEYRTEIAYQRGEIGVLQETCTLLKARPNSPIIVTPKRKNIWL